MRVLAVDDDQFTLQIVSAVVEAAGHECRTADNGELAWEMLSADRTDVVISDWRMPGMDGLELCRRIRAAEDGYTYIVLVSGRSDPVEVLQGMRAGADDYLTKPLDLASLQIRLIAAERVTALHGRLSVQQVELERLNTELAAAARIDPLTGLRNRRALSEDLPRLLDNSARHGHELSAVMVDVDKFKAYNDRFGHPAGDEALRRVAAVFLSSGRRADLFYRYGGEEFLCLLPQDSASSLLAAERLRCEVQALGIPHPDSPQGVVTFSAGVASCTPLTLRSEDSLLTGADEALYRAKAGGRNSVRAESPDALL